jgi:hypothetical protein
MIEEFDAETVPNSVRFEALLEITLPFLLEDCKSLYFEESETQFSLYSSTKKAQQSRSSGNRVYKVKLPPAHQPHSALSAETVVAAPIIDMQLQEPEDAGQDRNASIADNVPDTVVEEFVDAQSPINSRMASQLEMEDSSDLTNLFITTKVVDLLAKLIDKCSGF